MAQSGLKEVPASWVEALASVLGGDDRELIGQAVATARALPAEPRQGRHADPAPARDRRRRRGAGRRSGSAALAAVPGGSTAVEPATLRVPARASSTASSPPPSRSTAADVLSRARLDPAQLGALADALKTAGPLEVDRLLTAFEQSTDEAIGLKLVKVLGESSALLEPARRRHQAAPGEVRPAGPGRGARRCTPGSTSTRPSRRPSSTSSCRRSPSGDVRRGQAVFHSEKAACFTCHAIGYRGGNVGPDLTKVGQIRTERDLLEAIVYPSASFVRSYEPVVVATADGKVLNGLLQNETSDEIVLVTGANQEARIARADIEEIRPSTVSVMPAGLDQQLTTQELADLVAFLKACR